MKPFEEQDITEKLRIRAEIRRKIGRGSGERDRIADLCEEAALEIDQLRKENERLSEKLIEVIGERPVPELTEAQKKLYTGISGNPAFSLENVVKLYADRNNRKE